MKKRILNLGLVCSVAFGLLLGFIPQDSEAQSLVDELTSRSKCHHNVNTSTDGLTNFCSNSVCVEEEGTGGTFAKCG